MAVVLVILYLFLPLSPFCQEVKVSTVLEVTEALMPDLYLLPLTVSTSGDTEREVLEVLGAVDETIRSLGLPYRGGDYSVGPWCWWDKEKERRVCKGYRGSVNYIFRLKEASDQNRVLEAITGFKGHVKMDLSVGTPRWEVSRERVRQRREELELQLVREAKEFAKKLSEGLGQGCRLSEINFEMRPWGPFPVRAKALHAPEPVRSPQEISVKATVRYICSPPTNSGGR